jgi:hypothetical protein
MNKKGSSENEDKIKLRNEIRRLLGEGISIYMLSRNSGSLYGSKEIELLISVPREITECAAQEKNLTAKLKPLIEGNLKKLYLLDTKAPYTKEHQRIKMLGIDI